MDSFRVLLLSLVFSANAYILDDSEKDIQYYPADKWKPYYVPEDRPDSHLVHGQTW
jgi:hypothetical protein